MGHCELLHFECTCICMSHHTVMHLLKKIHVLSIIVLSLSPFPALSPLCPHLPYLQSMGSSGVYLYQPHIRAVTDFALPCSHASTNFHLLSTSTDGTLRSTDFEKGVLDLVS